MLTVNNLTKSYGSRILLDNVSLRILPGEKIGFIGANGTGKTTFLKIISGEEKFDSGECFFDDSATTVSFLSQIVTVKPYNTVYNEVKSGIKGFAELEMQLREVEEEMLADSEDPLKIEDSVRKYGELREKFDHMGGDDADWQIDRILLGLGFSLSDKERFVSEFSGGWKMRIEFAKLLLRKSDLLILDEPTNHLDLKAVMWLEDYLSSYQGSVIIVSHDRYFLNKTVTKIVSLASQTLKTYNGNYDNFVKQRNLEQEILEKTYKEQQKRLERENIFIERFRYKATLASRVKSKEKMISKRELVEKPIGPDKKIHLNFGFDDSTMTTVFQMKNLEKQFTDLTVSFSGGSDIYAGDRIALIGDNGTGKSTLLSILSGKDKYFSGKLKVHAAANIKYYLQNQELILDDNKSVIEEIQAVAPPDMTITTIRTLLGSFLFRGDDVFKKIEVLSGGEKARLALAMTISSPSNVLLLDEPTNHLDIDSREALAVALDSYQGTIIIVSHDRYFLDQICNRVLVLDSGSLTSYDGDYSFYLEKVQLAEKFVKSNTRQEPAKHNKKKTIASQPKDTIDRQIKQIESDITKLENRLVEIENEMSSQDNLSDPDKISELSHEYNSVNKKIDFLMKDYEEIFNKISSMVK